MVCFEGYQNRLAHLVAGNPTQVTAELETFNHGEAVYRVQGKLGVHNFFVQGGSGLCGYKAYIKEGACGHVDVGLQTHQILTERGFSRVRFASLPEDTTSLPEEPHAFRKGLSALGDPRAQGALKALPRDSTEGAWLVF